MSAWQLNPEVRMKHPKVFRLKQHLRAMAESSTGSVQSKERTRTALSGQLEPHLGGAALSPRSGNPEGS